MDLTFLSGRIPLTKTITYNSRDDVYTTAPYPMIARVSSHIEAVSSLHDFAHVLRAHAAKGHCLLKGHLDQALVNASRAGHSIESEHEWVVFDFDKVNCAPTHEGALAAINKYLPLACQQADAIIQLSASCYHPRTTQLSAHVFMQLETPASSQQLKDWLEWINFNSPLKNELKLTDSQMGMHFPLDRTVASGSKLIYIAPPKLVGFKVDTTDSIRFIRGKTRTVTVQSFTPVSGDTIRDQINTLRRASGLEPREYRTIMNKGQEFLVGSEECVVHDIQKSGDTYLRFNLNGGDSLAYFVNLREPHVIGNFKGEPFLYTKEATPQFYKVLTKAAQALPMQPKTGDTVEPLAFYATNRGSAVYIGYYDRATDELRLDPSTETAAKSWMMSFGAPPTGLLPHLDVTFDMSSEIRYEPGYPIVNLFRQTDLMKQYANPGVPRDAILEKFEERCPVTYMTMMSFTGDSREAVRYLVNWLAHIFQTRSRADTAWIWHGTQGTGKGMFINNVIVPLFGEAVVRQVLYSLIDTKFNAFMEGALIVVVDEASLSSSVDRDDLMSKLKNWITEPTIQVIEKNKTERKVVNTANLIFNSNSVKPVVIEDGDRRFNVGEHQGKRLIFTPNQFAILTTGEELPSFAQLLGLWSVDENMLLQPYAGSAKDRMYEATHTLVERIAKAIQQGETDFFLEARPTDLQLRMDTNGRPLPMKEYDMLLRAMIDGTLNVLKKEDLYVLFRVVVGNNDRIFPENNAEQRRVLHKLGLGIDRSTTHRDRRNGNKPVAGWKMPIDWKKDSSVLTLAEEVLPPRPTGNVLSMRS